jgi:hypothetical protein
MQPAFLGSHLSQSSQALWDTGSRVYVDSCACASEQQLRLINVLLFKVVGIWFARWRCESLTGATLVTVHSEAELCSHPGKREHTCDHFQPVRALPVKAQCQTTSPVARATTAFAPLVPTCIATTMGH